MIKISKKISPTVLAGLVLLILVTFSFAKSALAFCPICTVAVGAGVGLSRYLKIDDTVTGLWIGAFFVSISLWTINYLIEKKIKFFQMKFLTFFAYLLMIVAPLYRGELIGHPLNKIWGIDKLLLGIGIGSVIFAIFTALYFYSKKKNNGHAHFPFEKIVFVVAPLAAASVIFYYITGVH
ncbi:MAG: hypothetical protein NTZ65_00130 [Candidatus Berkelbacteria bacterium]|nr:hypothetical protein [Candidatus Berkelbacteria bacterium]